MTVKRAKTVLTLVWVVLSLPLLFILIVRQLNGFYGADAKAIWTWATQYVFPPLTLIAGVWSVARSPSNGEGISAGVVFWVSVVLSASYLISLYLVAGARGAAGQSLQSVLEQSGLFLSLLQALTIGFLGKFFVESGR